MRQRDAPQHWVRLAPRCSSSVTIVRIQRRVVARSIDWWFLEAVDACERNTFRLPLIYVNARSARGQARRQDLVLTHELNTLTLSHIHLPRTITFSNYRVTVVTMTFAFSRSHVLILAYPHLQWHNLHSVLRFVLPKGVRATFSRPLPSTR